MIITPGRDRALGDVVDRSLTAAGFTVRKTLFQGESTYGKVERTAAFFEEPGPELDEIVEHGLNVFFIRYEPFEITHDLLKAAILEANEFGKAMERDLI